MRIRSLTIGLVATAAVMLVPERTAQSEAQFVMNFATVAPDNTPWSKQLRGVEKRIEAQSNGRIQVKLFLGGSLGSEIESIQDVARGERIQGGGFSTGAMGEAMDIPILSMIELPYLFSTNAQADAALDEVLYEPTKTALEAKGFVLGGWAENGWRNFATTGPASTPAELSKFKMRSQESPIHMDMYKLLGVQAVAKPTSEVLPSLNTGIVDGFDNTALFSLAAGWLEPTSHYTLSRHIYQPASVVYSKKFLDAMPAELQKVVIGDPLAESVRGRTAVRALEGELLDTIRSMGKTVVELTPEQREVFKNTTRPVHKTFLANHRELIPVYKQVLGKLQ
ncbi:MAG: C4-dicarboxylate ABC transporter substrate-binding protein [Deltaproteobacteria bacterium]|nr:C4-dicarboxylate ABC transporter substrate-binding protein [Deltaproteobacteria bacterium]